jgi:prepilin-type processing-associated H-X9-DG protein
VKYALPAADGVSIDKVNEVILCRSGGEVYAFHPAGANIAFGDTSVKLLTSDISIRVFASLVTRAGGEVITGDKGKY